MDYKKKNKNFFRVATILVVINLFSAISGSTKYNDSQILKLLSNHCKTNIKITKLGANIYTEKTKRTFQLEISSTEAEANKNLIHAFSVLFKLGAYAQDPIQKCKLIIHIENYDIPVIAICDYKCSKKYFLSHKLKEKEWRDNCLIIRTI
tara:strand:- start:574 stop:1023 length:450 start_codon:yes stop_codon:yes gene_type:complete